jgi:antitoxin (DNA-binding transcriptional repressor) of toxin-antitoxin stability system
MQATIADLRYRMNDVLKALDRNESVRVLYRGKLKAVLSPVRKASQAEVRKHPFFGMDRTTTTVEDVMQGLRGGRHRDL